MVIIYAIYNKSYEKFYIGQTEDLEERMAAHNDHRFPNCYTARFDGEWQLIYKEEVAARKEALIREKQLKSFRGREFIKSMIKNSG
ncbi:MAG: GIY-YIG nuclease family protein [Patescibacteria group bacterium]